MIVRLGVVMLIMVLVIPQSTAQKRKRVKKNAAQEFDRKNLPEEKKAEVEHYFIEAEKYYLLQESDKALELFIKVLSIDPNNSTANFKIADILSNNKENGKALSYAEKALSLDGSNKYFYLLVANIYTNLGNLKEAIRVFQKLTDNVPGTEQYYFDMAALQLYEKDYDAALASYDKVKEHFGPLEHVALQKQQIYLKQNRLDLAIKEGEELIEAHPGQAQYVVALAQLLISNNKLEEAKSLLDKSLKDIDRQETIGVLLAEIYRKSGDVKKALEVLGPAFESQGMDLNAKVRTLAGYMGMLPNEELNEPLIELVGKLLETHPDSYHGYAIAGDLHFNTGNKTLARSHYLQAITLDASNYNIWQNVISIDMELEEYDSATAHSEKALEIFPNQAALYYFGGTAYLMKKNYDDAIRTLTAGKPYTQSNAELRSVFNGQLGDAYNSIGDHKNSDAAYEEALKAKPDNDHVLNNYSYFLSLRKEKLEKALKMSAKLVTKFPDRSTYLDTYAWVLYVMGDYKEAKKYLEKAVEADGADAASPTIVEHYGDVLFQLGQVEAAVEQWEKARSMSSDTDKLDKKIADRKLYE